MERRAAPGGSTNDRVDRDLGRGTLLLRGVDELAQIFVYLAIVPLRIGRGRHPRLVTDLGAGEQLRLDDHHADAVRLQLLSQRLAGSAQAPLRRAVGAEPGRAEAA